MESIFSILVLSTLVREGFSAPLPPPEETVMFLGEDFHIQLPPGATDVVFERTASTGGGKVVLMKAGVIKGRRAWGLNQTHLVLEDVREVDEGLYTVTSQDNSTISKSYSLIVRDCSNEHNIMYGENFHIQLTLPPKVIEFRPIAVEANQASLIALVLMIGEHFRDVYENRLFVSETRVTLTGVTGADEGAYTIRDIFDEIQKKVCLDVKVHQNSTEVPSGGTLKFNLVLNSSMVHFKYTPASDSRKSWLIMQKGNLTIPEELDMQDRLSVDGNLCVLENVKATDAGVFLVTDLDGFHVAETHLMAGNPDIRPAA
ncbi:uncharacterized protein LOC134461411 [Engraulis encrasicolus]|uniref:uncharacterized protein LOC134461411 n=1 Tax=Engraulis encrasicolus TaxID=184585 RepID=UPI002FD343ED